MCSDWLTEEWSGELLMIRRLGGSAIIKVIQQNIIKWIEFYCVLYCGGAAEYYYLYPVLLCAVLWWCSRILLPLSCLIACCTV